MPRSPLSRRRSGSRGLQVIEHRRGRLVHLLAEPFGDDRDVDVSKQFMRVHAQPAAIERGEYTRFAAVLRIEQRRIGLVAVKVQRAAAGQIEDGVRRQVVVIPATHDGALAVLRHDEG